MAWFWITLMAIFSTVIPSYMIAEAIARIGPAQTGVIGTLGPIMTMGMAILILSEPFTLWHLVGMMLVISGVSILSLQKKAEPVTNVAEVNSNQTSTSPEKV